MSAEWDFLFIVENVQILPGEGFPQAATHLGINSRADFSNFYP